MSELQVQTAWKAAAAMVIAGVMAVRCTGPAMVQVGKHQRIEMPFVWTDAQTSWLVRELKSARDAELYYQALATQQGLAVSPDDEHGVIELTSSASLLCDAEGSLTVRSLTAGLTVTLLVKGTAPSCLVVVQTGHPLILRLGDGGNPARVTTVGPHVVSAHGAVPVP